MSRLPRVSGEAIWQQHLYGMLSFVQRQSTLLLLDPKSCPRMDDKS